MQNPKERHVSPISRDAAIRAKKSKEKKYMLSQIQKKKGKDRRRKKENLQQCSKEKKGSEKRRKKELENP